MKREPSSKSRQRSRPLRGKVGIFWWHNGKVLAVRAPARHEQDVDYRFFHQTVWPAMQYQYPKLQSVRCDQLPQGRVWFFRHGRRFWVQMNEELLNPSIKAAVLKAFGLSKQSTDFGVYRRRPVLPDAW